MPQIQSGQVTPGKNGAPELYGVNKPENSIPFQERMSRLFKAQEYVTIKNVTDRACFWQYLPESNEHEGFSEDGMQRIITREAPEMWVIQPGDTEVIIGASAYRALDSMYKNYMALTTLKKFKDPNSPMFSEKNEYQPRNFNFADGGAQDKFLAEAYLGKAQMLFETKPAVPAPQPTVPAQPAEQPVEPEQSPVEDTIPVASKPEGAPLGDVQYAVPDGPAQPAKAIVSAKKK